jgi:hypothetical protein
MFSTQSFLQVALGRNLTTFVDFENATCDFTRPLFVDLLTAAVKCTGPETIAEPGEMFSGESRICEFTVSTAKGATACCRLGQAAVMGYPSEDGGTMVVPVSNLAVNANGQTVEALAFMDDILDLNTQKNAVYAFPLSQTALEDRVNELESLYSDMPEVAQDSQTLVMQMVQQIGGVFQGDELLSVILEEAQGISAGVNTAEDAAEVIQQRLSILLSEQS